MCPICSMLDKIKNVFQKEEEVIIVSVPDHINSLRWESGKRKLGPVMCYTKERYDMHIKEYGDIEVSLLNI